MLDSAADHISLLCTILRPVIQFCLRRAITSAEIIEAVKHSLVDAAVEELKNSKVEPNVSRLSAMTRLDRRDISRLLRKEKPAAPRQSWVARLLGQWEQDKRFLDKEGNPRPLSLSGRRSEFRLLCAGVSQDINPAALLFELERVGAVAIEGDIVSMKERVHDQHTQPEKLLGLLYRDTESLIKAVSENLSQPEKLRNLHARTSYDNISRESLPAIRRWLLEQGALFHRQAREFLSKFDKDINPEIRGECNSSVCFTTFSWTDGLKDMPKD